MRRRLTAAFLLVTLFVVCVFALVRWFTLGELIRAQEGEHLQRDASLIAELISQRAEDGQPVDAAYLEMIISPKQELEVSYDGLALVVGSTGHDTPRPADLVARAERGETQVTLRQSDDVVSDLVRSSTPKLALTAGILILLAGVVGYWLAGHLARPFRELARAGQALGRGRFDLVLPPYSVPEAEAIAGALRVSAGQVEASLQRDQTFVHQASHALRTPLTGLRLELDDLAARDDVPVDVGEAARRCLTKVERLDSEIDGLMGLARESVPRVETTLEELARTLAQHWTDALAERGRGLRATVDGDLQLMLTPGPVEQLLDRVLADVVSRGAGRVSLGFEGEPDQLRVRVQCGSPAKPIPAREPSAATDLVNRWGGRLDGDAVSDEGLEIILRVR